jgi:hypothetical protein
MFKNGFAASRSMMALPALICGAAVLALWTGSAAAAGPKCQTMMRTFDRVVTDGGKASKVAEAKKHRKAGAAALASGDEAACRKSLEQAQTSIVEAQRFMAIDEPAVAQ